MWPYLYTVVPAYRTDPVVNCGYCKVLTIDYRSRHFDKFCTFGNSNECSTIQVKVKSSSILITEHLAQSWSRCTGSQPTGDFSHPGSRLPLLSARPADTFPTEERHCPSTSTKLYCLVTEAHRCPRLLCSFVPVGIEPTTYWLQVQRLTSMLCHVQLFAIYLLDGLMTS